MSPPPLPGPLTRTEALAIIRACLDPNEYDGLVSSPDGLAVVSGLADTWVDFSARLDRSITARHLLQRPSDVSPVSPGPTFPTVTLSIARTTTTIGTAFTIPAGTVVQTDDGHLYGTDVDLAFAAGQMGPLTVSATGKVAAYATTVIAGSITSFQPVSSGTNGDVATVTVSAAGNILDRIAGDRFFPPFVGLYVRFTAGANTGRVAQIVAVASIDEAVLDPTVILTSELAAASWTIEDWGDLGFTVTNPADTTQGTDPELDELAEEQGRRRLGAESDVALRSELLHLVDTISPGAVVRMANRLLGPYGPITMYETGSAANYDDAPALHRAAFPGFVADASPCDVEPDAMTVVNAESPASLMGPDPPIGLMATAPLYRFFLLRWDGAGLGDPGCYAFDSDGSSFDAAITGLPMSAAADVSPCDGYAAGDEAIRAGIFGAVERIRAAGYAWTFMPRFWPVPLP